MLFNKLFLLTLAATSMIANVLCERDVVVANATNGSESQSIDVNYMNSGNSWSSGNCPAELDITNYNKVNLFRNCEFHGEELIGEAYYSSLSENGIYYSSGLSWFSHNINLYSKNENSSYKIAIPFNTDFFNYLSYISIDLQTSFYIPAIKIDNDLVGRFYVNGSSIKLVTFGSNYLSVSESYCILSDYEYQTVIYFNLEIQTSYKKNISHISSLDKGFYASDYGSVITDHDGFYNFDYKKGYVPHDSRYNFPFFYDANCMVSPYDITYLDLSGGDGDFSLGNSIYGEVYGASRQVLRLVGITFAVNYKGISEELDGEGLLQLNNMDESDYHNFVDNENFEVPVNEFVYLSRGRYEDEVGGEGSLINAFYIPNPDLSHIDDSMISVYSMTFINAGRTSWVSAYDPRERLTGQGVSYSTETYYFPYNISSLDKCRGISFAYHGEDALGYCSQRTVGINCSNEHVSTYHSSGLTYFLANIFIPFFGTLVVYASDTIISGNISEGKNIQRILFNVYDSRNQIIKNIHKIQFCYQKGNREPLVDEKSSNIYNLKPYSDLTKHIVETESSESLLSVNSNVWRTVSTQENGFMALDEGEHYRVGEYDYRYFYQNIYDTKTRSNFMCYWSLLSVWYVKPAGTTERLTTSVDGYYLKWDDEKQDWVVVSIDNPDVDSGITIEEYLNGDTYGSNEGFEPPEDNDFDKKMKNLFNGFEDFLENFGKWFLILNAVVLGIGLIGGVAYLIIRFGGFLGLGGSKSTTTINLNGANSVKKSKPKKKKRNRKKGK